MSGDLTQVVNVQISLQAKTVSRQAFGYAAIVGCHTHTLNRVDWFNQATFAADMVAAGFVTTDPIYQAVNDHFSPSPCPTKVAIVNRQMASQDIVVVTATEGATYSIKIQSSVPGTWTECSYVAQHSDTAALIAAGLVSAITASVEHAGLEVDAAVASTTHVQITPHSGSIKPIMVELGQSATKMTLSLPVASDDVDTAIAAGLLADGGWYGVIVADRTSAQVQKAMASVESNKRVMMNASADANTINQTLAADTTSLAALNKLGAYTRTGMLYSGVAATKFPDANWMGVWLCKDPGRINIAHKTLSGITVDNLSATQSNNAHNKLCSTYETLGGVNVVEKGWNGAASWLDSIRDVDWLQSTMQADLWQVLVNSDKVPITQAGIDVLGSAVRRTLDRATDDGKTGGVLAPFDASLGDFFSVPKITDISDADRASRTLSGIKFQRRLAGAFNNIVVSGIVTP